MKQILLSLILLSSIPLFSKNAAANPTATVGNSESAAAASAAADVKTKAANASASAAAPEAEAKGKESEADRKVEVEHQLTFEQLRQIASLSQICDKKDACLDLTNACIVMSYLLPKHEMWKTIGFRAGALLTKLERVVATIACPQRVTPAVLGVFNAYMEEHYNAQFPQPLASCIADYAQSDVRPLPELFSKVMSSGIIPDIQNAFAEFRADDAYLEKNPRVAEYQQLLRTHGVVLRHDRSTFWHWHLAGFGRVVSPDEDMDRAQCRLCTQDPLFDPEKVYSSGCFGDVVGLFPWRNPWVYHQPDCPAKKRLQDLEQWEKDMKQQGKDERGIKLELGNRRMHMERFGRGQVYGEDVPVVQAWQHSGFTQQSPTGYFMMHIDLHARKELNDSKNPDPNCPAATWLRTINELSYWMLLRERKHAYVIDPQAWIKRENQRAVAHKMSVQYNLPETPATK